MPKTNPATTKKTPRHAVDWEAIERDYRAGLKSLREISEQHGVSHTGIRKRAARDGWDRDLSAKIKAKAEALVSKAEVSSEVSAETVATENAIVEANATAIMRVRMAHRRDIARASKLAMRLLDELEATCQLAAGEVERMRAIVIQGVVDAGGATEDARERLKALDKLLDFPTRTGAMKMLADTMTKLIALEREAYSLATDTEKDKDDGSAQLAELLSQIDGAGTGLPSHARHTEA